LPVICIPKLATLAKRLLSQLQIQILISIAKPVSTIYSDIHFVTAKYLTGLKAIRAKASRNPAEDWGLANWRWEFSTNEKIFHQRFSTSSRPAKEFAGRYAVYLFS